MREERATGGRKGWHVSVNTVTVGIKQLDSAASNEWGATYRQR